MKKGQIVKGVTQYSPRVTENSFYPDVDNTYSLRDYTGDRISIPTRSHKLGIKTWSNTPANMQGMAIYNNLLVRMANVERSTTHYIFTIGSTGTLTQAATFTLATTGHSNALQFAPTIEEGNTYPYLYVSDLTGSCEVLSISSAFAVAQVQKITIPTGWQVQIGDDGYIWAIAGSGTNLHFIKYRKVLVSEGNVTLTSDDILEDIYVNDKFDSASYTFQGSKFKYGKAWLPIGTTGSAQNRALLVFDLAQHRTVANIDLTSLGDVEFEDLDFWDDAMVIASYAATNYILRF